jgi:hypothetical protein
MRITASIAIATLFLCGAVSAEELKIQPIVPIDPSKPDASAKSGIVTRIGKVWDCDMQTIPPKVAARADHGKIGVVPVVEPACDMKKVAQSAIIYQSSPGFKGMDNIYIIGFRAKGRYDEIMRVKVD